MTPEEISRTGVAAPASLRLVERKSIGLPTAVFAVDAHPGTGKFYAACFDGGVYETDANGGARKVIGHHASYASGVRLLARSGRLVSAGYDGMLRWFDLSTGAEIRSVRAHSFWSWKMRVSPDEKWIATVTGQYLAGGLKYEPAQSPEPTVKVYDAETGQVKWELAHTPPVLSVSFSPDGRSLAAANMMGEVKAWDLATGRETASWTTPDFTSWGIIKSHHYIGGIFDLTFSPNTREVMVCGMGPMADPMAGNGKQTWQRFVWSEKPAKKSAEIQDNDAGHGLMEVIRYHPDGETFLMAGRLAQGKWNTALFDAGTGRLIYSLDTKMRVTDAVWLNGGASLALSGATGQERKKDGKCPDFGHIKLYDLHRDPA